jgi:acyl carrier protein
VVTDIAAEVRDILVFHLGLDKTAITENARFVDDLGADSLDIVEVVMSCEERFHIDIPTKVATGFVTVGDAVGFIRAQLAEASAPGIAYDRPRLAVG